MPGYVFARSQVSGAAWAAGAAPSAANVRPAQAVTAAAIAFLALISFRSAISFLPISCRHERLVLNRWRRRLRLPWLSRIILMFHLNAEYPVPSSKRRLHTTLRSPRVTGPKAAQSTERQECAHRPEEVPLPTNQPRGTQRRCQRRPRRSRIYSVERRIRSGQRYGSRSGHSPVRCMVTRMRVQWVRPPRRLIRRPP